MSAQTLFVGTKATYQESSTQRWPLEWSRTVRYTHKAATPPLDTNSNWLEWLEDTTLALTPIEHQTTPPWPNYLALLAEATESWTEFRRITQRVPRSRESPELEALLNEFTQLPENWNSYGASPISDDVAKEAKQVLRAAIRFGLPKPGVSPGGDGSVDLEWAAGSAELHICIHPDTEPTYLLVGGEADEIDGVLSTVAPTVPTF